MKLKPLSLGFLIPAFMAGSYASAADYCTSGSLTRTSGGRNLNSFELTDGTTSLSVPVNQSPSYGSPTYFDKTANRLVVTPGATITFSGLVWTGAWMHAYAYVDYDNDGTFNTTLNADGTTDGELVAYSYYNVNDTDGASAPNSRGVTASRSSGVTTSSMPDFTLPLNLKSGDYRMRFKIDWNSLDPCGTTLRADGGVIVDVILAVEAPAEHTVTIKSNNTAFGSVGFTDHEGLSVTTIDPVEINATPAQGYMFISWTNDATGNVFAATATATVGGSVDMNLTANFDTFRYLGMTHTYTNNANQSNRYLGKVTTAGTLTPTVFSAASADELPFTAFTATPGTFVEAGALIDKTANPIKVEHGTTSFDITYFGWNNAINGNSSEINWTQEAYFVDWNKNGSFADEGEYSEKGNIDMPNAAILSSDGFSRTVTIPAGMEPGTYRMRVVFYEPADKSADWPSTLFTSLNSKIRNGVAYDFAIEIQAAKKQEIESVEAAGLNGYTNPGAEEVKIASVNITTSGALEPAAATSLKASYTGTSVSDLANLRLVYTAPGVAAETVATLAEATESMTFTFDKALAPGLNTFTVIADVAEAAAYDNVVALSLESVTVGGDARTLTMPETYKGLTVSEKIDYTEGNAIWFDTPNSSTAGAAVWNINDFSGTDTNPDQIWERKSFPIGNGSFGGNILGSVNRERVVLNEKTLWKGGPATGASTYWNMNRTVSDATLSQIRQYLVNGNNYAAHNLVSTNYRGNINYNKDRFGTYTTMGEIYVSTGIDESKTTNYKRIMNMDRSMVVVEFEANGSQYQRRYFASYPDSVMVWRYTSDINPQELTLSFNCPQNITSVTAEGNSLVFDGRLDNNNMQWALRVAVRTADGGTVTADATARTITVSGSKDVEFILSGDTDYVMNFNPSTSDPNAFVGTDPVANVNANVDAALAKTYDQLYASHYEDYSRLFDRVKLEINPSEKQENLPTPTRLARYRQGTLDHELEQQYFQYGRYLLISSSRAGNMPANLQGMWHNNIDGPWRVDYHNNINLQMNYWPATCTNLLECFTPFIDYVKGLVEPGKRTAQAYYGARGWTAEVSTNIFGFTAPLNDGDMSWNYNPTAGPWLTTQIWEYYDYTRDKEWLRTVGYPIIKESADFVSDLLYNNNGVYTSAPSYSPEHGTCDLGATYANAVTREVLIEAIESAGILGVDEESVAEWSEKLAKMYPYQIGRYGQLQEWYRDIDTYNDTHRHTNHLFGLHPGTTINSLKDTDLVEACKETLRQRGDAATGWSMGWKLNHWARLLDGDHAYVLFQNLLKNGTADNMWDLHPPFQIDGNFGGTAGVSELFVQSHNGLIHLLPALPSSWTDGKITGLRTRGNFEVDVIYAGGKLDHAVIRSNAGEPCKVYYAGKEVDFETQQGGVYTVTYNSADDTLKVDSNSSDISGIEADGDNGFVITPNPNNGSFTLSVNGSSDDTLDVKIFSLSGQVIKEARMANNGHQASMNFSLGTSKGMYLVNVTGPSTDLSQRLIIQ